MQRDEFCPPANGKNTVTLQQHKDDRDQGEGMLLVLFSSNQ